MIDDVTFDFDERVVVVTGASSGIGRRIALMFSAAGATVVLADVNPNPTHVDRSTHDLIAAEGGNAEYVQTDVTNPDELDTLIERARQFGGVDVMVNNAGVNVRKSILDITPEDYELVTGVNFRGVVFGCQCAASDMIDRGVEGCIINTASIRTDTALHAQILYNSTKGAIKMATRSAALDLAEFGIRVNGISPGRTVSGMADITREASEMAENEELVKPIPIERPAHPSEIAPTVLYIASDAASYMTGELVTVDGGWSIY